MPRRSHLLTSLSVEAAPADHRPSAPRRSLRSARCQRLRGAGQRQPIIRIQGPDAIDKVLGRSGQHAAARARQAASCPASASATRRLRSATSVATVSVGQRPDDELGAPGRRQPGAEAAIVGVGGHAPGVRRSGRRVRQDLPTQTSSSVSEKNDDDRGGSCASVQRTARRRAPSRRDRVSKSSSDAASRCVVARTRCRPRAIASAMRSRSASVRSNAFISPTVLVNTSFSPSARTGAPGSVSDEMRRKRQTSESEIQSEQRTGDVPRNAGSNLLHWLHPGLNGCGGRDRRRREAEVVAATEIAAGKCRRQPVPPCSARRRSRAGASASTSSASSLIDARRRGPRYRCRQASTLLSPIELLDLADRRCAPRAASSRPVVGDRRRWRVPG